MWTTNERIEKMIAKIEKMISEGKSLKEINKITYDMRELDHKNWIYFSWLNKGQGADDCLAAAPTKKQKELYEFIHTEKNGIYIYADRVEFNKSKNL